MAWGTRICRDNDTGVGEQRAWRGRVDNGLGGGDGGGTGHTGEG